MEILTKEHLEEVLKKVQITGLLDKDGAMKHLSMNKSAFERFIWKNPHLRLRNNGTTRYCPKMLVEAFKSDS